MAKEEHIELEGVVISCGSGGKFKVETDEGGIVVDASLSGKMRRHRIRVVLGDRVTVAFSPYDAHRGLITFRRK